MVAMDHKVTSAAIRIKVLLQIIDIFLPRSALHTNHLEQQLIPVVRYSTQTMLCSPSQLWACLEVCAKLHRVNRITHVEVSAVVAGPNQQHALRLATHLKIMGGTTPKVQSIRDQARLHLELVSIGYRAAVSVKTMRCQLVELLQAQRLAKAKFATVRKYLTPQKHAWRTVILCQPHLKGGHVNLPRDIVEIGTEVNSTAATVSRRGIVSHQHWDWRMLRLRDGV